MEMHHHLARAAAGINYQFVGASGALLLRNNIGYFQHMSHNRQVLFGHVCQRCNMFLGNDQQMYRSSRMNVLESHNGIVLVDDVTG